MQRSRLSVPWKIFLLGIPFGIFNAMFNAEGSIGKRIFAGVVSGLLYGGLMALILSWYHRRKTKNIPDAMHMSVAQSKEIEIPLPYDKAFEKCISAIHHLKRIRLKSADKLGGKIFARGGLSWESFGENISLELKFHEANSTKVIISSEPMAKTTVVDYGKNLENVEKISSALLRS